MDKNIQHCRMPKLIHNENGVELCRLAFLSHLSQIENKRKEPEAIIGIVNKEKKRRTEAEKGRRVASKIEFFWQEPQPVVLQQRVSCLIGLRAPWFEAMNRKDSSCQRALPVLGLQPACW